MLKTLKTRAFASLRIAVAAIVPFDGKAGWKTVKEGDKEFIELKEGNPVWVNADGTETTLGGDTITRLNAEAAGHRKRAEKAEEIAKAFEGLDPAKAREALDTVKDIKQGDLIKSGELERVKTEIGQQYAEKLTAAEKTAADAVARADNLTLQTAFNTSQFVKDKIAVPLDMVQNTFGKRFVVENGEVFATDVNGQKLMSKAKLGEYAKFDEAFEMIVSEYPARDAILKGNNQQGSGNQGGGGGGKPGQKTYRRSEIDSMSQSQPGKVAEIMAEVNAGNATLSD